MQEYDNIFKRYKNYYLFYISKYENTENFLKELYLHSYLINQKNSKGENLSHLLAYEGMTEKYYPYLEMGGENILTNDNNSALHYCVSSGSDTFLMIDLIKNGFDPLFKNINGQTPIHLLNSLQSASYFSNWNFRTLSKIEKNLDNEGNSIAHSAAINKRKDIVDFLVNEYTSLKKVKNKLFLTPQQLVFLSHLNNLRFILQDIQFYKLFIPFLESYFQTEDNSLKTLSSKSKKLSKSTLFSITDILKHIIALSHTNENLFLFNLYTLNSDPIQISLNLFKVDNLFYIKLSDQNQNIYSSYIYDTLLNTYIENIAESKLLPFFITRKNLTCFDRIKPLSIHALKMEARSIFKESNLIKNDVTEIYDKEINNRKNATDHNFHFDFSKKI